MFNYLAVKWDKTNKNRWFCIFFQFPVLHYFCHRLSLNSREPFADKENLFTCLYFGRARLCSEPSWKGHYGGSWDIWTSGDTCHICQCRNRFTSTLSLPSKLPCILWMTLWSAQLLMSGLLKPSESIRQHHSRAGDTVSRLDSIYKYQLLIGQGVCRQKWDFFASKQTLWIVMGVAEGWKCLVHFQELSLRILTLYRIRNFPWE